jgi:hypothetical protein
MRGGGGGEGRGGGGWEEGGGEEGGTTTGKLEISWKYLSMPQAFMKTGFSTILCSEKSSSRRPAYNAILKQVSLVIFTCSKLTYLKHSLILLLQ